MTIKDQIIQELDQVPESELGRVLEVVRSLTVNHSPDLEHSEVWQAYLASKQERAEVYRRLADS